MCVEDRFGSPAAEVRGQQPRRFCGSASPRSAATSESGIPDGCRIAAKKMRRRAKCVGDETQYGHISVLATSTRNAGPDAENGFGSPVATTESQSPHSRIDLVWREHSLGRRWRNVSGAARIERDVPRRARALCMEPHQVGARCRSELPPDDDSVADELRDDFCGSERRHRIRPGSALAQDERFPLSIAGQDAR